eukprot:31268-Pelagococcus_subviridis.AAC.2
MDSIDHAGPGDLILEGDPGGGVHVSAESYPLAMKSLIVRLLASVSTCVTHTLFAWKHSGGPSRSSSHSSPSATAPAAASPAPTAL